MNRIQMLLSQLDCLDEMMTAKLENERARMNGQFYSPNRFRSSESKLSRKKLPCKEYMFPSR